MTIDTALALPLLALAIAVTTAASAEEGPEKTQRNTASQGILFATPLLSEMEQAEYRARVRGARNADELEKVRSAHYDLMKARAKERGVALPENRPQATGDGGAFGPALVTEEERASVRAKARSSRLQNISGGRPPAVLQGPASSSGIAIPAQPTSAAVVPLPIQPAHQPASSAPPAAPSVVTPRTDAPLPAVQVVMPGVEGLFGPELMGEDERAAYRARLRGAKSDGERQTIRAERDREMRARAKALGVKLPQ